MIKYTYITKDNSITVFVKGAAHTALNTHPNYDKIVKGVKKGISEKKMLKHFDTTEAVREYLGNEIKIKDGVLLYKGKEIRNTLTTKILRMMDEGFDIEPMLKFLVNLRQNPSKAAQDELMLFMEANELPITPEGNLLAYKSVREDYMDYYSGTFDNSIGSVCEMERLDVCDDRSKTCEAGMHLGHKEYSWNFGGGGHLMVCAVNPRDVVSIPYDYKNMKMRCCKYKVVGEVPRDNGPDRYTERAVYEEDPECQNCGSIDFYEEDGFLYCEHCLEPV